MLQLAIQKGVDVTALEKLVALHERMTDRAAAAEFAHAMHTFQSVVPPIEKTSKAEYVTKKGSRVSYLFAKLEEIAKTINPLLADHGLSYTWDSEFTDRMLHVTCWVRHVNGHRECAKFSLPVESSSAMSEQQKHAAALSYGRRQSLIAALGLVTADPDTDGVTHETLSPDQQNNIEELLEASQMDRDKFFRFVGVPSGKIADIPEGAYEPARNLLTAKYKKNAEKGA
jgi:hypothetical protein